VIIGEALAGISGVFESEPPPHPVNTVLAISAAKQLLKDKNFKAMSLYFI